MARKSRKQFVPENTHIAGTEVKKHDAEQDTLAKSLLPTAAYIRLSAENSGNTTDDTLKTQILMVESYVRSHKDLTLRGTYVDNGFTGTNFERPEFLRMMEDVKKGVIRCIVVKDLSRFGRDYLETGYYLETIFPLLGVRFIAITDPYDSDRKEDRDSLAIPIKNMVNAMYAKDFSRKQEAFHELCRRTGRYVHHTVPFGYQYAEDTGRLVIDPEAEPYIRLVFAWTLAGITRGEIARRMEVLGAPTASTQNTEEKVCKWTASTVKHILFNPVYAGFHVMGKSRVSKYRGIEASKLPRDKWLYFPDFHEAYISMEDYQKIEGLIQKSKNERHQRLKRNSESRERMHDCFQGMVYCADCGRQMNYSRGSHHRDYSGRSFQYYRCRYDQNISEGMANFVQQNYLKIIVTDQIRALIQAVCDRDRLLSSLEAKYNRSPSLLPMERNVSRLTGKIKDIEGRMIKAYTDFSQDLLDEETYQIIKKNLADEKAEVSAKREEYNNRLTMARRSVQRFHDMAAHLAVYEDLHEFDESLTKELVSRIIVGKDSRVELVFNCMDVFEDPLINEYAGIIPGRS